MSYLKNLNLSAQTRAESITSPKERRREKLITALQHQIKAAEAAKDGLFHSYPVMRTVTHAETGMKERKEVMLKVRPWWWSEMDGDVFLIVKYGHKKLELADGKSSVKVGKIDALIPTLELLIEAVKVGELDRQIETVATRPGKQPKAKSAKA